MMEISCIIRKVDENLVVEGYARTRKDIARLKRIISEMLDDALEIVENKDETQEKVKLQPIMEIGDVGVVAYVRMPNPGRTFPASGEDLERRL